MSLLNVDTLDWTKVNGLMPAVIQDNNTGKVLMLGYMNKEALSITIETKKVTFFSRTKQSLWTKGETSGNFLNLVAITQDCDNDALLVLVNPVGPTCHKASFSCFDSESTGRWEMLTKLQEKISDRAAKLPENSYTTSLLNEGLNKIAQKVGEEGVETVIAALQESRERLASEAADLLFHLLVLLKARDLSITDIYSTLKARYV